MRVWIGAIKEIVNLLLCSKCFNRLHLKGTLVFPRLISWFSIFAIQFSLLYSSIYLDTKHMWARHFRTLCLFYISPPMLLQLTFHSQLNYNCFFSFVVAKCLTTKCTAAKWLYDIYSRHTPFSLFLFSPKSDNSSDRTERLFGHSSCLSIGV